MIKTFFILTLISFSIFAEKGAWEVGPQLSYSGYLKNENYSHGMGVGVNSIYNLTDFWGIASSLDYSKHFGSGKYDIINIYAGVTYNLDILRLVPLFEAGFSGTLLNNYDLNDNFFSINIYGGFALSYLIDWQHSISVFFRYETALNKYDEIFNAYFLIGLRFNFIFEPTE
jgi:hypothetical protein